MATLRIDYSEAADAAKYAGKASEALGGYADAVMRSVSDRLGQLTGGSTANTSGAASLASQKARKLRDKAGTFSELQGRIERFSEAAQEADANVASHINSVNKTASDGLNFLEKGLSYVYGVYAGTIGQTGIGKALNELGADVRAAGDLMNLAQRKVSDWFIYGDGQYVLNIVSKVAECVEAVALVVGAIASGAGVVVVVAAIVAAAVSIAVMCATYADNKRALGMSDEDPGAAAYYGDTDSLSSYTKKHIYNRSKQNKALAIDITGKVAKIIRDAGAAYEGIEINPFRKGFKEGMGGMPAITKPTGWTGVWEDLTGKFGFSDGKPWSFGKLVQESTGFKTPSDKSTFIGAMLTSLKLGQKVNKAYRTANFDFYSTARKQTLFGQVTTKDKVDDIMDHIPVISNVHSVLKDFDTYAKDNGYTWRLTFSGQLSQAGLI